MTQAAASPTPIPPTATPLPTPTFTPTPLPYDLSVKVVDEAGEPISGATLVFSSLDYQDAEKVTDENGMITWTNLPEENAYFKVNASGYYVMDSKATVQPGSNEITVTLAADPLGLLPATACVTGEKPLMIEDVQDQTFQGWGDLSGKLESGVPGFEVVEDAELPGNYVLKVSNTAEGHTQIGSYNQPFGDAVVRLRTRNNGSQHLHVGWHSTESGRYLAFIYADQAGGRVDKFTGDSSFTAFSLGGFIGDGQWHTIEISTFNDVYEIWINGVKRGSWEDKQPLYDGYFFIDADFWKPDLYAEFDNFSVCELSAPFTSILAEE